jgi:hypothetical protein
MFFYNAILMTAEDSHLSSRRHYHGCTPLYSNEPIQILFLSIRKLKIALGTSLATNQLEVQKIKKIYSSHTGGLWKYKDSEECDGADSLGFIKRLRVAPDWKDGGIDIRDS